MALGVLSLPLLLLSLSGKLYNVALYLRQSYHVNSFVPQYLVR